jgi:two-component SAPR family response regulator
MFKVITVDDEAAALRRFERIASADERLELCGSFQYARDALAFVRDSVVDFAFIDIEMPEMNGLELAERLLEADPHIKVIFVTAYSRYALEAFRAHAIGYLLKPYDGAELKEQIDQLQRRYQPRQAAANTRGPVKPLTVRCLGQFAVYAGDDAEASIRWKTSKSEELFALLLHWQGKLKTKDVIIDALWPELEPERSANLFRVTCTYLRTALAERGYTDILIRERDSYKINVSVIDCDMYRLIADSSLASVPQPLLEDLSALYKGEYLAGKDYGWAEETRIMLEKTFKKIQLRLSVIYEEGGDYEKAREMLERVLSGSPYEEDILKRLLTLTCRAGQAPLAAKLYADYKKLLLEDMGIAPSFELKEVMQ